jgi:GTP-binding protein
MAQGETTGAAKAGGGGPSVRVTAAEFVQGASSLAGLPKARLPEVALIGRSNVGKSSLINRLANRSGLARASSTPGRTQEVNLFRFTLKAASGAQMQVHLADLPGYGYAKASHDKRDAMASLLTDYLTGREGLRAVCLLIDGRRDPEEEERTVVQLAQGHGRGLVVTVTKADKLGRTELAERLAAISGALDLEPDDLVVTGEKLPPAAWWKRVLPLL